jgi:hypothetical protein
VDTRVWYDGGATELSLVTRVKNFLEETRGLVIDVDSFAGGQSPEEESVARAAEATGDSIWLVRLATESSARQLKPALRLLGVQDDTLLDATERYMIDKANGLLHKLRMAYLTKSIELLENLWERYERLSSNSSPRAEKAFIDTVNAMLQFAAKRVLSDKPLEKLFNETTVDKEIQVLLNEVVTAFETRMDELDLEQIRISSKHLPLDVRFCDGCGEYINTSALACSDCTVHYYCSEDCADEHHSEHMGWCRGGRELREIGDLFLDPTLENRGTVMRTMSLPNGWKYLEFAVTSTFPDIASSIVTRDGRKIVPLLSVPLAALGPALPIINFLSITVQVNNSEREPSREKPFYYSVHHYRDHRMDGHGSELIKYAAMGDTRHVLSYPMMLSMDEHRIPRPAARLGLSQDDVIAVGLDPAIARFSLTVQVYLTDRDGHMW